MQSSSHETNSATQSPRGLLLVGHGTRNIAGRDEMRTLSDRVASLRPGWAVEPCFLELAQPTIRDGVRRLAQRDVVEFSVAPLLLFAAGHAKRDIPQEVEAAVGGTNNSIVCVAQAQHFGCHPKLLALAARRFDEAVASLASVESEQTLLIVVGRGSNDASATAEMHQFAALRSHDSTVPRAETCFIAMAQPSVAETLAHAAASNFRRVVVQPHLLFQGDLLTQLRHLADDSAAQNPNQQWVVTNHLGPDPFLADMIWDLVDDAACVSTQAGIFT